MNVVKQHPKALTSGIAAVLALAVAVVGPLDSLTPSAWDGYFAIASTVLASLSVYWAKNGPRFDSVAESMQNGKYAEAAKDALEVGGSTSAILVQVLGELQKLNRKQTTIIEQGVSKPVPPTIEFQSPVTVNPQAIRREIERIPSVVRDFASATWGR